MYIFQVNVAKILLLFMLQSLEAVVNCAALVKHKWISYLFQLNAETVGLLARIDNHDYS